MDCILLFYYQIKSLNLFEQNNCTDFFTRFDEINSWIAFSKTKIPKLNRIFSEISFILLKFVLLLQNSKDCDLK